MIENVVEEVSSHVETLEQTTQDRWLGVYSYFI